MADFLTRLAERALGLAPTIQPVLPALYAPGTSLVDRAALETVIEAEVDAYSPPESRRMRRVDPEPAEDDAAQEQQAVPPAPTSTRPQPVPSNPIPGIRRAPSTSSTAGSSGPPETLESAPATVERAPTAPAPPPDQATSRSEPVARSVVDHHEPPVDRAMLERFQTDAAPARSTSEHAGQRLLVPASNPTLAAAVEQPAALHPAQQERPGTRATVTPLVRETRQRVTSSPPPSFSAAEQPAHTPPPTQHIHVSIGRIEVRAVTPSPQPAPRPSAPPAPKMSLDDYLRSQSGGRR